MRLFFLTLIVLVYYQLHGQIEVDTLKRQLIVQCSSNTKYNDSLFSSISKYPRYKRIIIITDDDDVKIDISKLDFEEINFYGNGSFNITNSSKEQLYSTHKITIFSNLKNINFGKGLKNLDTLVINNAGLEKIPASIKNCINLKFIDLSYNKIRKIGSNLKELKELQYLNLSYNKLSKIPASIYCNKKLIIINFERNQITIIPVEILYLPDLRVLNLIGNKIFKYPEELLHKKGLKIYGIN